MLRTIAISIAVSLPAVSLAPAAQPAAKSSPCPVHVQITDEDGKALPEAFVLVHGEHGSNQQFTPDKTGQLKVNLHAGMYDLFVSASGFLPQAQLLDVRSCKPRDINLMLTIDSDQSDDNGF